MKKIGERRHYVRIVEPVAQAPDALGHCETLDVELYQAYASLERTGGGESSGAGDQTQASATYRLELPWPGPIPERCAVVLESGRRLEVQDVDNVNEADAWCVLTCGENR